MRGHTTAHRADTGEPVVVPATWVDNPNIFGGLFLSAAPKPARRKREPVETKAAAAAPTTEPGDAGDTTTEE